MTRTYFRKIVTVCAGYTKLATRDKRPSGDMATELGNNKNERDCGERISSTKVPVG